MPHSLRHLDLRCPACRWRETCGPEQIFGWLVKARKLRSDRAPDLEILYELFRAAAGALVCPRCGRTGLEVSNALDEKHAFPPTPECAGCGRPIEPERIEAVPGTRFCAACQNKKESGRQVEERDFCPRCGAPLTVRIVGDPDRPRYVLACSAKPPCPL